MVTVMMRPRVPRVVEPVAVEEPIKKFSNCGRCVTRKMCQDECKCIHGAKAKRKKSNGRNG